MSKSKLYAALEKARAALAKKQSRVKPLAGQSKDEFLSYCMGHSTMISEFSQEDQRYAVCLSFWEGKKIEPNPCWSGYEAIGLKPDGSPNCVPID